MKLYKQFTSMVEKSVGRDIESISTMSIHQLWNINNSKKRSLKSYFPIVGRGSVIHSVVSSDEVDKRLKKSLKNA